MRLFTPYEVKLLDEVVARMQKLNRPFTEEEAIRPLWEKGHRLYIRYDNRFKRIEGGLWVVDTENATYGHLNDFFTSTINYIRRVVLEKQQEAEREVYGAFVNAPRWKKYSIYPDGAGRVKELTNQKLAAMGWHF